jgi:hypothetical protein
MTFISSLMWGMFLWFPGALVIPWMFYGQPRKEKWAFVILTALSVLAMWLAFKAGIQL